MSKRALGAIRNSSNFKSLRILCLAIITILFSELSVADQEKTIIAEHFEFSIPVGWSRASSSDEHSIRSSVTRPFKSFAEEQSFFVFSSPKGYMIIVYDLKFSSKKPSLEQAQNANKQNFRMGKSQGIVRSVLSNNIIQLEGVRALENDWVGTTQKRLNRNLTYILYTEDEKVTLNVSAFFPENDNRFAEQIRNLLPTIELTSSQPGD